MASEGSDNPPPPKNTMLVAVPTEGFIPGLEPLLPLDQIFMKQGIDILEVVIGFEQANHYTFFAPNGQMVYVADEESDCLMRQCFKNGRPFKLHIRDPNGNGIILDRPCACLLTSMDVFAIATGQLLGKIQQECVCCCCCCCVFFWCPGARFNVLDELGNVIFVVKAPCITMACFGNVTFDVVLPSDMNTPIGKITKVWAGIGQEMFTQADNFGIAFPGDLSVKMKAVLLGACVLMDFMYYENSGDNNNNRGYY